MKFLNNQSNVNRLKSFLIRFLYIKYLLQVNFMLYQRVTLDSTIFNVIFFISYLTVLVLYVYYRLVYGYPNQTSNQSEYLQEMVRFIKISTITHTYTHTSIHVITRTI